MHILKHIYIYMTSSTQVNVMQWSIWHVTNQVFQPLLPSPQFLSSFLFSLQMIVKSPKMKHCLASTYRKKRTISPMAQRALKKCRYISLEARAILLKRLVARGAPPGLNDPKLRHLEQKWYNEDFNLATAAMRAEPGILTLYVWDFSLTTVQSEYTALIWRSTQSWPKHRDSNSILIVTTTFLYLGILHAVLLTRIMWSVRGSFPICSAQRPRYVYTFFCRQVLIIKIHCTEVFA